MEIRYLSRADVESLNVSMKEVLEAVDNGFRLKGLGKTEMPPKPGRENDAERIFSMNMGIAVDDMVTAKVLYGRAEEMNIGTMLPL